ncbi:flagellar biosynthetic protein FliO [Desulfobotulus sp. H1]|uniref:Flagellar protein n=1 Tax=Desulfobotulus pelophilus TaxID=2823377 RepID=A0ABT3N8M3_9BACT|nr:flagellar biosynthetic protein FliO [Desulfobotulus pelophilus]MCW7753805.1 flagellar biosynthetic protein FliO [Desulfobotulus pelophilus]
MEDRVGAAVPDFGFLVLKGGGALLLVLALLILTLYLLRRLSTFRGTAGRIRMVETLQLGPKERVVLIDYQGRELLLGVTPSSIQNLGEFEKTAPEETERSGPGFSSFLSRIRTGEPREKDLPEARYDA